MDLDMMYIILGSAPKVMEIVENLFAIQNLCNQKRLLSSKIG